MPPKTSYDITFRLGQITLWWLIFAEIAVLGIAIIVLKMIAHALVRYQVLDYGGFLVMIALMWLLLTLTRCPCTIELDDLGFSVHKHRRFNLLPRGEIKYSWEEFLFLSGGVISNRYRGYEFSIHLTNGKVLYFITGASEKELQAIHEFETEILQRVKARTRS